MCGRVQSDLPFEVASRSNLLLLKLDRVVHLSDGRPAEWRVTYRMDGPKQSAGPERLAQQHRLLQ